MGVVVYACCRQPRELRLLSIVLLIYLMEKYNKSSTSLDYMKILDCQKDWCNDVAEQSHIGHWFDFSKIWARLYLHAMFLAKHVFYTYQEHLLSVPHFIVRLRKYCTISPLATSFLSHTTEAPQKCILA